MEKEKNLYRAVLENDTNTVELLMPSRCRFSQMKEYSGNYGYNLLRLAISYRHKEIAKRLLARGAKIDSPNKHSNTLLHDAAINNDTEIIEILLAGGANVDEVNNERMTPLHCTSGLGNLEIAELLLKKKASVIACSDSGKMPLHYATLSENLSMVELLLKHGAPINGARCAMANENNINVKVTDTRGYTSLHYACRSYNEKLIVLLLSRGANVSALAYNKLTPLHVAAVWQQERNVKLLLDHGGTDVNAKAGNGETVLDIAVIKNDSRTLAHILKAHPVMKDEDRTKVLHKALFASMSEKNILFINFLVEHGFTVCSEDANNFDLLRIAVEKGCSKIVEDLLKYGADVDNKPFSLLDLAVMHCHVKVAEVLIRHGVDVAHAENECERAPKFTPIQMMNAFIGWLSWSRDDAKLSIQIGVTPLHILALWRTENHIGDWQEGSCKYLQTIRKKGFVRYWSKKFSKEDFVVKEITKLFLSRGANVDALTDSGYTPLHGAAARGNAAIVKVLLEYNADVNCLAVQDGNKTSLHYSAVAKSEMICEMLLENGAKVNVKDQRGRTPLHVACLCSRENVVRVLLKYGADVNSRDSRNRTPLYVAATQGSSEIVRIFLHLGTSEVDSTSEYGRTALSSALLRKWPEIVKDLLDYGSIIDNTPEQYRKLFKCVRRYPRPKPIFGAPSLMYNGEYKDIYRHWGDGYYGYDYLHYNNYCRIHYDAHNDEERTYPMGSRDESDDDVDESDVNEDFEFDERVLVRPTDRQTYEPLKKHIFKLNALHLIADKDLFETRQFFAEDYSEESILLICKHEIEKLKSTKIGASHVSFHDVLTKSTKKLSSYAKNKSIKEGLEPGLDSDSDPIVLMNLANEEPCPVNGELHTKTIRADSRPEPLADYTKTFPFYSGMIYWRFRKALYRNRLMSRSKCFLDSLGKFKISYYSFAEILSYLSDKDLSNLIKACTLSQD